MMKRNIVLLFIAALLFGCNQAATVNSKKAASTKLTPAIEGGGDHAGNGGFAYEKTYKLIELASSSLITKVADSQLPMFEKFPKRREILLEVLEFNNIVQSPSVDGVERGGKLLALDYSISPDQLIKLYRPFYDRFAGTLDINMGNAQEEVELLFLHEASHIWGYNDGAARKFAYNFLESDDVRPNDAVTISNYCACKNGKPVVVNNCESECTRRPLSSSTMLYVTVALGPEITDNSELKDLKGWCTQEYAGEVATNCSLRVYDEFFNSQILQLDSLDSNSFIVNLDIGNIHKNMRYKFELIVNNSSAKSNISGFKIEDIYSLEPFEVEPISMYSCILRSGTINTSDNSATYDAAITLNYLFPSNNRPDPIPSEELFTLCHDPNIPGQGSVDSILYPRLSERSSHISLWSKLDLYISNSEVSHFFKKLSWQSSPIPFPSKTVLGYFMSPLVDESGLSFCPNIAHYSRGIDPVLKQLSYHVGDTEAVYIAKRAPVLIDVDGNSVTAPDNIILINESQLKNIWFYHDYKIGKHIRGTHSNANKKQMMFYWPANPNAPLQPSPNSDLYTVKFPSDVGHDELQSNTRPADKRFGCIPKQ